MRLDVLYGQNFLISRHRRRPGGPPGATIRRGGETVECRSQPSV